MTASPIKVLQICDHLGWEGSRMHGVKRLFSWMIPRFDKSRFEGNDSILVGLDGVAGLARRAC